MAILSKPTSQDDDWGEAPALISRKARRFASMVAEEPGEESPNVTVPEIAPEPSHAEVSEPAPAGTDAVNAAHSSEPMKAPKKASSTKKKPVQKRTDKPKATPMYSENGSDHRRTTVKLTPVAIRALELRWKKSPGTGKADVLHDAIVENLDTDYLEKGSIMAAIKQAIADGASVEEVQSLTEKLGIVEKAQKEKNAGINELRKTVSLTFNISDFEALGMAADAHGTCISVELERCLKLYLAKEWPMAQVLAGVIG